MTMKDSDLDYFSADVRAVLKEHCDAWQDFEFAMLHSERFLGFGKPGSGKSTSSCRVGLGNRPLIRTCITAETAAAELRGFYGPGAAGLQWYDGPCIRAWRLGARLVIDEINEAGGDTIPFLHAILDDYGIAKYTLPNGETITPKEGFQCFATMNATPMDLPEALRDRFVVQRQIDKPNPIFLLKLPAGVRAAAANAIYSPKPPAEFAKLKSTRTWVEIGRLVDRAGLSVRDALRVVGVGDANVSKAIEAAHVKTIAA